MRKSYGSVLLISGALAIALVFGGCAGLVVLGISDSIALLLVLIISVLPSGYLALNGCQDVYYGRILCNYARNAKLEYWEDHSSNFYWKHQPIRRPVRHVVKIGNGKYFALCAHAPVPVRNVYFFPHPPNFCFMGPEKIARSAVTAIDRYGGRLESLGGKPAELVTHTGDRYSVLAISIGARELPQFLDFLRDSTN